MHLGRWGAVLVLGLAPGEALSSPFWSETGSMKEARSNHTATLLASGSVLVVGGSNLAGILSSAELYDPATGAWTLTGALVEARQQHSATLLPSGKVLVAGGWNEDGPLVSAELYDPGTGTWRLTGSLAAIRLAQTATLLASGGVLVAGGATTAGPSASSEVYDPETGTWAATGSMVTPHMYHTATLLPSGKVLVAGGLTDSTGLPGSELYDPLTGMWNATGPMATSHIYHSATLLPSGKVLVSAGEGADNPVLSNNILASAELYDPGTGTWQLTGSMATAREYHTATLLPSGMALISGGTGNGDNFLASAERYDPGTGTWSSAGSLATPRLNPTMTLLASGKVLVSGGVGADDSKPHLITILRTAEVYDPSATGGCSSTGGSALPLLAMVPLSLLGRRRSPGRPRGNESSRPDERPPIGVATMTPSTKTAVLLVPQWQGAGDVPGLAGGAQALSSAIGLPAREVALQRDGNPEPEHGIRCRAVSSGSTPTRTSTPPRAHRAQPFTQCR
jgi:hypothetical protein